MIPPKGMPTVVLQTGGLRFGDEKVVVERVLGRRPGVLAVSANPVSQTANVTLGFGVRPSASPLQSSSV